MASRISNTAEAMDIRLFEPQDAPSVAELFRVVYGDSYPIKTYYHPEELIAANADKEVIPAVACREDGQVVAFMAMYRSAPCERTYEVGLGLTLPEFRNLGLGGKLMKLLHSEGSKTAKAEVVFGESVANHVYTQIMCRKSGMLDSALEVDLMPAEAYTKEKSASGRVSAALSFFTTKPIPQKIYLPASSYDFLQFLYQNTDLPRECLTASGKAPLASHCKIEEKFFDSANLARLYLWVAGQDLAERLEAIETAFRAKGGIVFQIWLGLNQDAAGWASRILSGRGYFTGGIVPGWFGHDGMLMQKILQKPNWQGITLHTDKAKKILSLVRQDWQRTQ